MATPHDSSKSSKPSSQQERPRNAPDTAESYERAQPESQPGMGQMGETDNTPHRQPQGHDDSTKNNRKSMEITADETQDQADSVGPTDRAAHGNRAGADAAEANARDPSARRGGARPASRQERP